MPNKEKAKYLKTITAIHEKVSAVNSKNGEKFLQFLDEMQLEEIEAFLKMSDEQRDQVLKIFFDQLKAVEFKDVEKSIKEFKDEVKKLLGLAKREIFDPIKKKIDDKYADGSESLQKLDNTVSVIGSYRGRIS